LHIRDGIRIRQARRIVLRLEQPLEFHVVEPNEIEVLILFVENRQFDAEHYFVPRSARNGPVGCPRSRGRAAGLAKMAQDDHRDLFHSQLLGGQQAYVARDDVGADQNWVCPAPR
jgi:hypothetical protein